MLPRASGEHSTQVHLAPFIHLALFPLQAFVSTEQLMDSVKLPPARACPLRDGFGAVWHSPPAAGTWATGRGQRGETGTVGLKARRCVRPEGWSWAPGTCLVQTSPTEALGTPFGLPKLFWRLHPDLSVRASHTDLQVSPRAADLGVL